MSTSIQKYAPVPIVYAIAVAISMYLNAGVKRENQATFYFALVKCLPILTLVICCFLMFRNRTGIYTICGLLCSALGDYLMTYRFVDQKYFLFAIVPFGVSHIFYAIALYKGNVDTKVLPYLVLVAASILGIIVWKVKNATTCLAMSGYAVILIGATWLAMSDYIVSLSRKEKQYAALVRMVGFIVFCLSDMLIIIDAFVTSISNCNFYVMMTYYSAQILIVIGNIAEANTHIE